MRKGFREKGEDGTVMIEWSIGMLLCILILVFFIGFSMYLYQNVMFHVTANEAAQVVAEKYKYGSAKKDLNLVSEEDITNIGVYRYLWIMGKKQDRIDAANSRASNFLNNRLTNVSLAKSKGEVDIKVERANDDIGRHHIEITMHKNYGFLFGELMRFIGVSETKQLDATVACNDFDALDYVHSVKLAKYASEKVKSFATVLETVDKVVKGLNKFFS